MDRWQIIKKSKYDSWEMFGQEYKRYFVNIYNKPELVQTCYCNTKDYSAILKLVCSLHFQQNDYNMKKYDCEYFGWLDIKNSSEIKHVWPSLTQLKMCIDQSEIKHKEKIGEGVVVRLNVTANGIADPVDFSSKPFIKPEPEIEEIIAPVKKIRRKIMWKKQ